MPRFALTIKNLLMNKDKLFELAKIPLNENYSTMLLKKLPEKLGDPGKFLIPCDFSGMDTGSIITHPKDREDVFVKVVMCHFLPTLLFVEVIKSSVEKLVPIPRESEGVSDDTCDVPSCDNSPPLDDLNNNFKIFSDSNDDCTLSDNDSFENIDYVEASPPEDSLITRNEELSTIPEKESDEFIKSSFEDLVPIPSESEGTSENDKDIECKDSYDSNLDKSTILVIPLSDSTAVECLAPSDDIDIILYHDSSISVVSILEGFTDESPFEENDDLFDLKSKTNDWKKILYDAPIDDVIFDPGGDINEIDVFLDIDVPTDIKDGYHDSEGDILYLKNLLLNDTTFNLPPEEFLDHDPSNDLKIMVKVFNLGIHEKKISPTYVSLSFEDHHYFSFTYVIRTFLPYFTYPVVSPLLLSTGSEDTIFDPGIFT
ncbi:hypothetical protein Tco_0215329 [Tanacetum coccineum]